MEEKQNEVIPQGQVSNQGVQTSLQTDALNTQPISVEPMEPKQNGMPEEPPKEKGSKLRTFGVIFLFLLLFSVVFFLPEISEYVKGQFQKPILPDTEEEEPIYKKRSCTLTKTTADMNISIHLIFSYQNNNLKKQTLMNTVTFSSEDMDQKLYQMQLDCQSFKEVIENYQGIKQTCTLKDHMYTIRQDIDYENLEDLVLEQNIGELQGFYPEFTHNQDMKWIESTLTESGYICNSAS